MKYWLLKSEPTSYSIDDLKKEKKTGWEGVRNYQARNYMRDEMSVGDLGLFYHSNAKPPGVAGIIRVVKTHVLDYTAWDENSKYYDPKSKKGDTPWIMVEVEFVEKFPRFVPLSELHANPHLKELKVLQKGLRVSILPVSGKHFRLIQKMGHLAV